MAFGVLVHMQRKVVCFQQSKKTHQNLSKAPWISDEERSTGTVPFNVSGPPLLPVEQQPQDNAGYQQDDDVLGGQKLRCIDPEGTNDQEICEQIPTKGLVVQGHG